MRFLGLVMVPVVTGMERSAPAMGYNTWNDLRCANVSAKEIEVLADRLIELGLAQVGYKYLNVDDCWSKVDEVGPNGELIPDPNGFPDGILSLSTKIHAKGLKFGLYSCRGYWTCAGRPGSRGREIVHAQQFAEWEIDYLKYDSCFSPNFRRVGALHDYKMMSQALKDSGREILFAICGWSAWYAPYGNELEAHSWRIGADADEWANIYLAVRTNEQLALYTHGNGYNDPDMLLGSSPHAAVSLTPEQSRAQFALWAIMAAPLLIGASLKDLSDWDLETYSNTRVIAIDQDSLFIQGEPIYSNCPNFFPRDNWWCSPWSMPADIFEMWRGALGQFVALALVIAFLTRKKAKPCALIFLALAVAALLYSKLLVYYRPRIDPCTQIWAKPLSERKAALLFINFSSEYITMSCDYTCIQSAFALHRNSTDNPEFFPLTQQERSALVQAQNLYANNVTSLSPSSVLSVHLKPNGDAAIFSLEFLSSQASLSS